MALPAGRLAGDRDCRRALGIASRASKQPICRYTRAAARLCCRDGAVPPRTPQHPSKPEVHPPRIYVPVVADCVAAARQEFKFIPRFPQSETEFKRGYAKVALAAGLTREQIVRIYGFEATGNGAYDIEAGLEYNKHGRAITTALGYNQLL